VLGAALAQSSGTAVVIGSPQPAYPEEALHLQGGTKEREAGVGDGSPG